ncbi:YesL family protein [Niameybacter massiliensis]|uniref:YesL family protein n=1 Tax=Holtiella tumoricola TaxID=3018743 RepID=A0AA42J216_9FIRM|nr:YesL family protein [Holtiella tumoricola]MDA3732721.1 YesL family protein [Holtiella tumoricola]
MFNYDGPIYIFLKKVSDVTVLHLIWLLCSLPIITLGASTTALYGVALARKGGNEDSVVTLYLSYFRKHWKRGTGMMMILSVSLVVLLINLYYWNYVVRGDISTSMAILCTALLVPVGLLAIYGFAALTVYEDLSAMKIIQKSLYIAYAHPFSTLKLIIFWLLAIWFNLSTLFANVLFLSIGVAPFIQGFLARTLYRTLKEKEVVH